MNYQQTLDYLYAQLPMFQRVGAAAITKSLANSEQLAAAQGNPERKIRTVHVAGTNGKGSSSNWLAAVLQAAGYKVGLYTSPHLREFTERIKINGQDLTPDYLVQWVARWRPLFEEIKPSFFEMTVALAFEYFADEQVDIAIIEVGLGGRLDSTNIITPLVSLITNISFDHMALLGNTLPEIAAEKAGIIKPGVPVVVSQTQPEVASVFTQYAHALQAPLTFADQVFEVEPLANQSAYMAEQVVRVHQEGKADQDLILGLVGDYQRFNLPGVLAVLDELRQQGFQISESALRQGLQQVASLTGFRGRWQILGQHPLVVCDTGHNEAGIRLVVGQLARLHYHRLHIVLGTVADKDVTTMLSLLPKQATYYFCQAQIPRALPAADLSTRAAAVGLSGGVYASVAGGVESARNAAGPDDVIFIGGSTFVVGEIPGLFE